MIVARTIGELQEARRRLDGGSVGLVPTMGAFHEGHLSLFRTAREEMVASVAVSTARNVVPPREAGAITLVVRLHTRPGRR